MRCSSERLVRTLFISTDAARTAERDAVRPFTTATTAVRFAFDIAHDPGLDVPRRKPYLTQRLFNQTVKSMTAPDPLSATFSALSDPTRRAILARLAQGDATVGQLSAPFDMSMPAISKHLKVLERAGLIRRGRDAQWRPCQLSATPLRDAASYLATYEHFWNESFDRLTDYLLNESDPTPSQGKKNVKPKRPRR